MVAETAEDLREVVSALKHDLGKYVAWRSANLDETSWSSMDSTAVEALQADILRTRTARDGGALAAWDVWRQLSARVPEPRPVELAEVSKAVASLEALAPQLGQLLSKCRCGRARKMLEKMQWCLVLHIG